MIPMLECKQSSLKNLLIDHGYCNIYPAFYTPNILYFHVLFRNVDMGKPLVTFEASFLRADPRKTALRRSA